MTPSHNLPSTSDSPGTENESLLAGIFEFAPDGILVVDALGQILRLNAQAAALFGYKPEEVLSQPVEILIPLRFHERHIHHRTKYFTQPRLRTMGAGMELLGRRKDGSEFPVDIMLGPLQMPHGLVTVAVVRDITERKNFEHTLREKNIELEMALQVKDHFLGSMSHELRTPLNAIIGFTGTLLMKLPGPLNRDQEKQLSTIQSSARHLLSLINDLLDLAKIESGDVKLLREPVVCQSVIADVATVMRPLAEGKGLRFKVECPEAKVIVQADQRALSQILLNLSNNAIKFTEQGEVRLVLAQRNENGQAITDISVTDTGIGIRAEDQARLFGAFEQAHPSDARPQGKGLGLHLSRKLADLLGARITLQSDGVPGRGSTFTLVIPGK